VQLAGGLVQAHDFCDDDGDWTWFTAEARQVFTLTTSSWGRRADTFLAVYDTDGTTLLAANDDYEGSTDFSSRVVWQAPADGTYYARVSNRAALTGCLTTYDLWLESHSDEGFYFYLPLVQKNKVTAQAVEPVAQPPSAEPREGLAPLGIINHTCPDAYEVDDTWEQAMPIELDLAQVHSFDSNPALYAADKDFVWLELEEGETVTVSVMAMTNTQTLLELYDGEGNALGMSGSDELAWTAWETGRYYVSVSPLMDTYGCTGDVGYRIVAQVPPVWHFYLPIVYR
jgi:hypothetical protein